ncbi:ribonuclease H-like domain-containing protein [Xylariaceae sp. FL0804]|nr:ribonuclease H-like domain-containing protein [Xylariaceae sp. FL0804]
MDSSQFKSLQDQVQDATKSTTRLATQIANEDLSFQKTSDPAVEEELDSTSSRLLELTSSLLKSAAKTTDLEATAPDLAEADDVDVHWSRIVDVVDTLLEKADFALDEYTGAIKRKTAPAELPAPAAKKSRAALDQSMRKANMIKPQTAFQVRTDNLDTSSPWKPRLTKKPHAIVPLQKSLGTLSDENQPIQYDYSLFLPRTMLRPSNPKVPEKTDGTFRYKHPYETEILQLEYPPAVFDTREPIDYLPFESTSATFVNTFEGVLQMLEELKGATEIAIDTEHHDFRTYGGLLSLMQISTREKDWIVDTLQPWRHKLEVLNEVFADPKIIKVLHGAYMDIIWLQRDCGLYIVGLFDTYEAAVALGYPYKSLAYLLKRFVEFDADKKYQLADWRIRPLPAEMFYYARSDTHYLLYIFDMLRNELLQESKEQMCRVLEKSKETSLRRHESIMYDAEGGLGPFGWYSMLLKQSTGRFSREQFAVFRAVHKWRDDLARREDESPLFVMSNPTLFNIARDMPPDQKALHGLLDPGAHLAKRGLSDLFATITKAKAEGANGPSVTDVIRRKRPVSTMGIGQVAQAVFPNLKKEEVPTLTTEELVSKTSRLWGGVAMSSRWEEEDRIYSRSVQFELPWVSFVQSAGIMPQSGDLTGQQSSAKAQAVTEQAVENAQAGVNAAAAQADDGVFTLKAGLKRKAPTPESSESDESEQAEPSPDKSQLSTASVAGAEEIAIPDSDEEDGQESKAAKKAKKARKKAKRLERREQSRVEKAAKRAAKTTTSAGASGADNDEEEREAEEEEEYQPFDYSQAKSVLNGKRAAANGGGDGRKARFNPYGMAPDGPKPARRMHGEKPGKSATFLK